MTRSLTRLSCIGLDAPAGPPPALILPVTSGLSPVSSPAALDGATFTPPNFGFPNSEPALNAYVEPDADGDEYGDIAQGGCPTSAASQGVCPAAATDPLDTVGPIVTISLRAVTLSARGAAAIKLSCPRSEPAGCRRGVLVLQTASKLQTAARRRRVTLGRKSFAIAAGRTATVKVALSRKNRRLVAGLGRLKVRARATAGDQAGNKRTSRACSHSRHETGAETARWYSSSSSARSGTSDTTRFAFEPLPAASVAVMAAR